MPRNLARSTSPAPTSTLIVPPAPAPQVSAAQPGDSETDRATTHEPVDGETTARLDARHAVMQWQYDAYFMEQIHAAAKVVTDFRANTLDPHRDRKPLLWGRAAWKAKLIDFELLDSRNVENWKRMQQRRFTPQEAELAKSEANKRANLICTDGQRNVPL